MWLVKKIRPTDNPGNPCGLGVKGRSRALLPSTSHGPPRGAAPWARSYRGSFLLLKISPPTALPHTFRSVASRWGFPLPGNGVTGRRRPTPTPLPRAEVGPASSVTLFPRLAVPRTAARWEGPILCFAFPNPGYNPTWAFSSASSLLKRTWSS